MLRAWQKVLNEMQRNEYMSGVDRGDREKETAEVFTPSELVVEMLSKADPECFSPDKNILDHSCGDGQFLVAVKLFRMFYFNCSESDATATLYGVDIMKDNVIKCRERLRGGTIIVGDMLNPKRSVDGQTKKDLEKLLTILA
jgi:hypothetical protein